ncbi:MAG TPA: O-antigen ligase family protein [Puia sp.]|nr:O-antigen ligase family protein [Puia sp.]
MPLKSSKLAITNPQGGTSTGPSSVFLEKNFNFLVTLAVLLTTLFGWFNPNSWALILLAACRLFDGRPLVNIRTAFANPLFLAFFSYFLIGALGYLYTHNPAEELRVMTKEATIVAVAFVFCGGQFADERRYRALITGYCLLLFAASLYCLVIALHNYRITGDESVFFYHALTSPISQNAVIFTVYVLFGVIFLLHRYGKPDIPWLPPVAANVIRFALVFFFLGMIVLLSSRLLMVVTLLILLHTLLRRYLYRKNKRAFLITGSTMLLAVVLLLVIDNPMRERFREMKGSLDVWEQKKFEPKMVFSSLQSRLVEYRFAGEVMKEHYAWLFGVSPGDSQDLLDQKYIDANMDIGDPLEGPHRTLRGFLGFNYHNQYVETWVRSGLVGLLSLLTIFGVLLAARLKHGRKETGYILLTLALFFIPEAPLTLQYGIFLFCFFPLLSLSAPPLARNPKG